MSDRLPLRLGTALRATITNRRKLLPKRQVTEEQQPVEKMKDKALCLS